MFIFFSSYSFLMIRTLSSTSRTFRKSFQAFWCSSQRYLVLLNFQYEVLLWNLWWRLGLFWRLCVPIEHLWLLWFPCVIVSFVLKEFFACWEEFLFLYNIQLFDECLLLVRRHIPYLLKEVCIQISEANCVKNRRFRKKYQWKCLHDRLRNRIDI